MLTPALLALALAAAPPPAAKALDLVKAQGWEELYLGYAAASPDAYPPADRKKISGALTKGCAALEASDPVMAYSMGEKAAQLDPSADALLCVARVGPRADQRSAAQEALEQGTRLYPKDSRFPLALGKLLLSENDTRGAVTAFDRVGKKAKERPEADALRKKALALASEDQAMRKAAAGDARALETAQDRAGAGQLPPGRPGRRGPGGTDLGAGGPPHTGDSSTYESSEDGEGRRMRANKNFRFRYFNGKRDFGERAEYEGRVQAALEKAREETRRLLGQTRESATDVILYSREEFSLHHGERAAMAIAGFYSENAIRMNDSAEINPRNQATLVHEYTHAVVDELSGFNPRGVPIWMNEGLAEWVEWRHEGFDGAPPRLNKELQGIAKQGKIPRLKDMEVDALVNQSNPALRYAVSACAIHLLVRKKGVGEVLEMIKELGKGRPFDAVLEKRFDVTPEHLQEQLDDDLKSR